MPQVDLDRQPLPVDDQEVVGRRGKRDLAQARKLNEARIMLELHTATAAPRPGKDCRDCWMPLPQGDERTLLVRPRVRCPACSRFKHGRIRARVWAYEAGLIQRHELKLPEA